MPSLRFGTGIRLTLSALICLTALECIESPLEPVAPTSDVQLSIPLVDRTKSVTDFTVKDTLLKRSSEGGYFYESSQSIDPIGIEPITADPKQSSQQVTLGVFFVEPPAPLGDTLTDVHASIHIGRADLVVRIRDVRVRLDHFTHPKYVSCSDRFP